MPPIAGLHGVADWPDVHASHFFTRCNEPLYCNAQLTSKQEDKQAEVVSAPHDVAGLSHCTHVGAGARAASVLAAS